ncbi:MAG: anaerobic ribonucleoside-triphosphate reductase activating protein [Candidatus Aenigmatarchaeota archaeon]
MLRVGGILGLSTVDYPGKPAAVVFLYGCNFRCPFCHNHELVENGLYAEMETEDIMKRISENIGLIEAVTITGGEPVLQEEGLEELCRAIKTKGLYVKLDTNGSRPNVVRNLIEGGLVDFVAMDVKYTLDEEGYSFVKAGGFVEKIRETMKLLASSDIDYEIRMPVVEGVNDDKMKTLVEEVKDAKVFVLEQMRSEKGTLDPEYEKKKGPDRERMIQLAKVFKNPVVKIRTIEGGEETVIG